MVPDRPIPDSWPRAFGMDVGWNRTAVVWGAQDPGSGIIYLYSEHYQGMGEPASHAQAIRARGGWIPGVIDPACLGSSQIDGRTLIDLYRELGLDLRPAVNAVEAGHHGGVEPADLGPAQGDGQFVELVSRISQISP